MFATYKMQSIGNWLESSSRTLPGIITSKTKFHPSLNYSLEAIKHENKELIGIILGFGRSSSRMEYIDVNGEGAIDMDWSFKYVGLSVGVPLVHQETWVVAPNVRFLLIDNALGIDDYGGTHIDVRSVNLGISPGVSLTKTVKRFVARFRAGYEFQLAGKLHLPGDRSAYLVSQTDQTPITVNGDGLRIGIGVGFIISDGVK